MNSKVSDSSSNEPVSYTLVLRNRLDELTKLSVWINERAADIGISTKIAFQLDLVLAETVTNVINYAYENEAEREITIRLAYQDNVVKVEVQDDGFPFDPLQVPEAVLPQKLEDAEIGGLGIHLIRTYADECHYRRQADHNIFTIIMYENNSSEPE